ncbi:prephenate dehydrogenase [Thermoflavifilum thermophilum]|uniref:Prephenate dehydrogenase n=1 Tax=Thermoflavifilum thermophilum TaxID=1393122 RepID=A0A1I7MZ43_9BACT|nr:prephenate dehydrogenase [Thermoflavifilum thermophilum]SFV27671.1 prephenate dehydrogenase [Thermoflavifilum thermophilum]
MKIAIVGIGLIGGSLALELRRTGIATRLMGVEANSRHASQALERKLVDEICELPDAIRKADLVVLAVPVNALLHLLPAVLDEADRQIVVEVGSTKEKILQAVANHPRRGRLVASHPMAGTEYSGPEAAVEKLFCGKNVVLCNIDESDPDAVEQVKKMYETLGCRLIYMDAASHDLHAAYVSHISHITSFALALTVLEKEKEEKAIFDLASGGFASTVRLAKSSPDTWIPIFQQNRHNVLDVLYEHIHQLKRIKQMLVDEDYEGFYKLIQEANAIRKIIH